jgi:hypothetical protein
LFALRILLLQARLLTVRGLLRSLVAVRAFIRARSAPPPVRVRDVPPAVGRKHLLLRGLIVGATCTVVGFMAGRQYERATPARSPLVEITAQDSAVPADAAKPDLAPSAVSSAPPDAESVSPNVALVNPGTANPDTKDTPDAQPSHSIRAPGSSGRRGLTGRKHDEKEASPRRPVSYQDLRDRMLR